MGEWRQCEWGDITTLEYGKGLRGYQEATGRYRVFGTNGPIGWHDEPLSRHPGVIIGRKGAYRGVHYSPEPFYVIDTAFYLKPKEEMDLRWAYYSLLTYDINGMDSGSAIPSTSREAFYRLPVRVPPIEEQRAIACILGTLDDKIELNRRMNQTLEKMAQAIFKSWFVDFEPVRAKAAGQQPVGLAPEIAVLFPDAFEDSEMGEVPQGWHVQALYDTAQFINGAAFNDSHFCDRSKGLPIVKIAELKQGITEQTRYSCRDVAPKYLFDTGDMLYSWSGSPDTSLDVFVWTHGPGLLNQHIFKVITKTPAKRHFVYCLLRHLRPVLVETARNKQTTGLGHVTVADMRRIHVVSPPAYSIDAFEWIVGPILERGFAGLLEQVKLANLRDALLPKLISGELQIADAERIVERCM